MYLLASKFRFRVSFTIEPGCSLLQLITTNCLKNAFCLTLCLGTSPFLTVFVNYFTTNTTTTTIYTTTYYYTNTTTTNTTTHCSNLFFLTTCLIPEVPFI